MPKGHIGRDHSRGERLADAADKRHSQMRQPGAGLAPRAGHGCRVGLARPPAGHALSRSHRYQLRSGFIWIGGVEKIVAASAASAFSASSSAAETSWRARRSITHSTPSRCRSGPRTGAPA